MMPPDTTARLHLWWLVRLRWGALIGQAATIAVAWLAFRMPVPLLPLVALLTVTLLSNVVLVRVLRGPHRLVPAHAGALLVFDTLQLTALLFFTGGVTNPFSTLYLVHVALSAVMLSPTWTWSLAALATAAFGGLFFVNVPLDGLTMHHHGPERLNLHLNGMWVAFAVTAGLVAYFVIEVSAARRRLEAELERTREAAAQNGRLAGLATLAAGAAHELGSPLGTIAVVSHELERALAGSDDPLVDDARLIRAEVQRCRDILDQLSGDAGAAAGEAPLPVTVREIVREFGRGLAPAEANRVRLMPVPPGVERQFLVVPPRALARCLRNLVRNGLDASGPDSPVELSVIGTPGEIHLTVSDSGCGMTPEVLTRATEPFFTTKSTGRGLGLGLFLCRTVVDRLDGRLLLASHPGRGTTATLSLPVADLAPDATAMDTGGPDERSTAPLDAHRR